MTGKTEFILTFDEIEEIYREAWADGAVFNGDFSDEAGADAAEDDAWQVSRARAELFRKEQELSSGREKGD